MFYAAKLDNLAYWITVLTSALLVLLPLGVLYKAQSFEPTLLISLSLLPLVLIACFLYRVTGYRVDSKAIVVNRMIGDFVINLSSVKRVEADPDAMKNSLRTFGNGGLFGFYGRFRNKKLGSYRAFVTSTSKAVVVETEEQIFVLSPESPKTFLEKVKKKLSPQS